MNSDEALKSFAAAPPYRIVGQSDYSQVDLDK